MNIKCVIWLSSVILCVLTSFNLSDKPENIYYYYKTEKIYLSPDYTTISISMFGEHVLDDLRTLLREGETLQHTTNIIVSATLDSSGLGEYSRGEYYYTEVKFDRELSKAGMEEAMKRFSTIPSIQTVSPALISANGDSTGVSNNFYVKLRHVSDYQKLLDLAKKHKIRILGRDRYMPLWYVLSCDRNSSFGSIKAANFFYESGLFENAEPEFMLHHLLSGVYPSDPYFSDQWYLLNMGFNGGYPGMDINVEPAWSLTKGQDIKIAIFDTGFEMNHPDLSSNVYGTGYNAQAGSSPSIVQNSNYHATAVAGVAGAAQNTEGITGVAPEASLMSISIKLDGTTTWSMCAAGINWAVTNGADIINNSWYKSIPSSLFDSAISNALQNGRGNKGTIIVFSSGNNNSSTSTYPANSNPLILNVGAVDRCGIRSGRLPFITEAIPCDPWDYDEASSYGSTLDVVAGGSIISTTDLRGILGLNTGVNPNDYTNLDYTRFFGGTSAAAPQVAGLAALILSINPSLTVIEVNNIIERTAKKVRPDIYTYSTTSGKPNGTWNQYLGYGMIDACRAVHEVYIAKNTKISGPDFICNPSTYTISDLPPDASVTWSVSSYSGAFSIVGSSTGSSVVVQSMAHANGVLSAVISTYCGEYTVTKTLSQRQLEIVLQPWYPCGRATVIADVGADPGIYTWTVNGDLSINGGGQSLVTSSNSIEVTGAEGGYIYVSITGACPYTITMEESYTPYGAGQGVIGSHNNFPMMLGDPLTAFVESFEGAPFVESYRWILNGNLVHSSSSTEYNSNTDGGAWALECGMNLLYVEALLDCGATVPVGQLEFERMCE